MLETSEKMAKKHTVVLLLLFVIMLSYHVLEGDAHPNQVAFSRKDLRPEHKHSVGGRSPSLGEQLTGANHAGGVSKNVEIANVQTTTTTDTHRDVPVDLYRSIIIHGHQLSKP
ncbi:unnamed protein product [Alopecurus aequalis]